MRSRRLREKEEAKSKDGKAMNVAFVTFILAALAFWFFVLKGDLL
jgi:hypothetical protein